MTLRRRRNNSSANEDESDTTDNTGTGLLATLQQSIQGQEESRHDDGPSLADIDRSMRTASLVTIIAWLLIVALAYSPVTESIAPSMDDSSSQPRSSNFERLQGAERISALVAFVLLSASLAFRTLPLLLQKATPLSKVPGAFLFDNNNNNNNYHVSGIVVGGVTTQLIAIFTDGAMAFGKVPILVDPVVQSRVSVLRWAEFATLAFLMTFLTEVFGVHGNNNNNNNGTNADHKGHKNNKTKTALSIPMIHALCQGLSTTIGLLFPYCSSKTVWYTLLLISCILFSVIFPRLHYKQQAFRRMKPGTTLEDAMLYDRTQLSLKMLQACTICWTLFPAVFFTTNFILPALVPSESSVWRHPAIPMIAEAALDVISKLVQMSIIMDVHRGVFDDQDSVRALQRLDEVKEAIGNENWTTANDIVIVSVRQEFSGIVTSMVSPSAMTQQYLLPNNSSNDNTTKKTDQESLVFALSSDHFNVDGSTQEQLSEDHVAQRPRVVTGGSGSVDATRLAALGGLVVRAWSPETEVPRATLQHNMMGSAEKTAPCRTADVTRLEEQLVVIVVQGWQ